MCQGDREQLCQMSAVGVVSARAAGRLTSVWRGRAESASFPNSGAERALVQRKGCQGGSADRTGDSAPPFPPVVNETESLDGISLPQPFGPGKVLRFCLPPSELHRQERAQRAAGSRDRVPPTRRLKSSEDFGSNSSVN